MSSQLKESYSIWMMPSGRLAEALQREIDTQAAQHQVAPFKPHVTLLPDIEHPRAEVIAATEQLAKNLKPFRITFNDVTCGSSFHQCVYILCAKDKDVLDAAAAVRIAHAMPPLQPDAFKPHLSLLYSDADAAGRAAAAHAAIARLYGPDSSYDTLLQADGFTVESLAVWYTPVEDRSLGSWVQVADVKLQG